MKNITVKEWFKSLQRLKSVAKRVFQDIWPGNEKLIIKLVLSTIATAGMPFAMYWSFSQAVGLIVPHNANTPQAIWYICGALAIFFTTVLIQTSTACNEKRLWHIMQTRLNVLYVEHKGKLSLRQLEKPDFRDTVNRAEEKSYWPAINIVMQQFMNLSNVIRITAALLIMGAYDVTLCIWVIVSLIPQFWVDIRHGATLWGIFMGETNERRKYGELSRHLRQKFSLVELKMFQNADYFVTRISELLQNFQNAQIDAERKKYLHSMVAMIFGTAVLSVVLIIIADRAIIGITPLSAFIFIWSSTHSMNVTLGGALKSIAQQNEFALYVTDMYAVMDAKPETEERKGSIMCANRVPEIIFEHVTFYYPHDSKQRVVLKDVSFKISPGERLALVGLNAAGKTTIVYLLCGIYEPTEGCILIDGVDLREIDIDSWKKQLAVLFQDYAKYYLILEEVIGLGNTGVKPTDEFIVKAASQSGIDKFVADFPEGYKTQIGKDFQGGIELSGGQNQRTALARVAYRQGKVIILDEPTASLDVFAEAEIFEELEKRSGGSTLILITHRFSTIKNVEHIIVMDYGRVIEEGNHDSLMKKCGVYSDMFLKQAKGYMSQPIVEEDKE